MARTKRGAVPEPVARTARATGPGQQAEMERDAGAAALLRAMRTGTGLRAWAQEGRQCAGEAVPEP